MTSWDARNTDAGIDVLEVDTVAGWTVVSSFTRVKPVAHLFGARDLAVFGARAHLELPLLGVIAAFIPSSVLISIRALTDALRATH